MATKIIYNDFKKAFDKILFIKSVDFLKFSSIADNLLAWLIDIFDQRTQQVWFKGSLPSR